MFCFLKNIGDSVGEAAAIDGVAGLVEEPDESNIMFDAAAHRVVKDMLSTTSGIFFVRTIISTSVFMACLRII